MRALRIVLTLAVALAIATPLLAAEQKKGERGKRPQRSGLQRFQMLKGLELSAEQKTKVAEVTKELAPKMREVAQKMRGILTDEQKKARADASKAAKAAGKKGKEVREAVDAATKLTDEQKTKMAAVRKEMAPLQKAFRDKILGLLTADQKAKLKKARGGDKQKREPRGKKKEAAAEK